MRSRPPASTSRQHYHLRAGKQKQKNYDQTSGSMSQVVTTFAAQPCSPLCVTRNVSAFRHEQLLTARVQIGHVSVSAANYIFRQTDFTPPGLQILQPAPGHASFPLELNSTWRCSAFRYTVYPPT